MFSSQLRKLSVWKSKTKMSPQHVAIIMDGNGRWAKSRGMPRLAGHRAGTKSVSKITEEARRLGIRYVTLFGFSTENWKRSSQEVSGLMDLFKTHLDKQADKMLENGIRLRVIGDLERLPATVRKSLERSLKKTESNTDMDLILAMSYGGREEIISAAKDLARKVKSGELDPDEIDHEKFESSMWSAGIPDPELLIRTSGEMRISNFLLWQLAYSEMVVTDVLWPDFDEKVFAECLKEFESRERRFGLTSEQLESQNLKKTG